MLLCGLAAAPKAQAANVKNQKVSQPPQTDYNRARTTIVSDHFYRIFTIDNNMTKYYVTADGKLSTNFGDAPAFLFKEVSSNGAGEYEYGFQIQYIRT